MFNYVGVLVLLVGCRNEPNKITIEEIDTGEVLVDLDGDGYFSDEDCDDNSNAIYPQAEEICDGLDNDCDEEVDEDVLEQFYLDSDGDGFGDDDVIEMGCEAPDNYVPNGNDCDDQDVYSFPGAIEICDGLDNDCDEVVDEDVLNYFFQDADGDGVGTSDVTLQVCEAPENYVSVEGDCDDNDGLTYPGAVELCDNTDNDCDGEVDEDSAINVFTWYEDADEDGFGDVGSTVDACAPPTNYVSNAEDCDDINSAIYPGATEVCDEIDNDCDGDIDDADSNLFGAQTWYLDHDGDGYGDSGLPVNACSEPLNYVADSSDCNDLSPVTFPGATEVCDGMDNDCDGLIDDADSDTDQTTMQTFYEDTDADGFGSSITSLACVQPTGFITDSGDCDDGDSGINPNASEQCDSQDNNCDGVVDESTAIDAQTWYLDHDGDSFGDASFQTTACDQPVNYVSNANDCDDLMIDINPDSQEVCDEVDNDCDGLIDDADDSVDFSSLLVFYEDADGDGYGSSVTIEGCAAPLGYSTVDSDCDDGDSSINPDATEVCDGVDSDCSGVADDDPALYGLDYACGALSCEDILFDNPSYQDGVYWIDPDGNGSVAAYCNMSLAGGGWTLVGKFTNQDSRNWANSSSNWIDYNNFGNTNSLSDGTDAKSELWYRMVVDDFLLNDHLNQTDYVHTNDGCIDGTNLADYFTQALASFPYSSENYYEACSVEFTNHPNWGLEPNWNNQIATSANLGLNASSRIAIAKTDGNADTSGVISFYEPDDPMEADVGLGALEDGTNFTNTGTSQDIGGPTSCGYNDVTCAVDYPETVFFWVR
jgi:hypothetical protein